MAELNGGGGFPDVKKNWKAGAKAGEVVSGEMPIIYDPRDATTVKIDEWARRWFLPFFLLLIPVVFLGIPAAVRHFT